jgi:hypothetical protein
MPTTENDRRNLQQVTLEKPSMPDHDRRKDPGMHSAGSTEAPVPQDVAPNLDRVPLLEDPDEWLTSDPPTLEGDLDPEERGDSLVDQLDREIEKDKH